MLTGKFCVLHTFLGLKTILRQSYQRPAVEFSQMLMQRQSWIGSFIGRSRLLVQVAMIFAILAYLGLGRISSNDAAFISVCTHAHLRTSPIQNTHSFVRFCNLNRFVTRRAKTASLDHVFRAFRFVQIGLPTSHNPCGQHSRSIKMFMHSGNIFGSTF